MKKKSKKKEKNNKIKIIMVVFIVILIIAIFLLSNTDGEIFQNEYETIVDKMNNKESFNLLLIKDKDEDMIRTLDYYSEVYDIKYEQVDINVGNRHFDKIANKILIDKNYYDNNIFAVIKKGKLDSYLIGYLDDKSYKEFLINNSIIDKEYKEVDVLIKNALNIDYKHDNLYNILFIGGNDNNANEYRKILVKNKAKSFVLYLDNINQIYSDNNLKEQIKFDNKATLPVLVKMKNDKVLYSKAGIALDDFEKAIK